MENETEIDTFDNTPTLLNKRTSDLTVKDSLKLNGAAMAIAVLVPVGITALFGLKAKISQKLAERKVQKLCDEFNNRPENTNAE